MILAFFDFHPAGIGRRAAWRRAASRFSQWITLPTVARSWRASCQLRSQQRLWPRHITLFKARSRLYRNEILQPLYACFQVFRDLQNYLADFLKKLQNLQKIAKICKKFGKFVDFCKESADLL